MRLIRLNLNKSALSWKIKINKNDIRNIKDNSQFITITKLSHRRNILDLSLMNGRL